MLILTHYITQHELKPLRRYFELSDIFEGAEKVLKGLAIETKPPKTLEGFKFFKVRIGRKVKGRMIVFMVTESKQVVPILIRLKKDKVFGMNMAMNNLEVIKQINSNLEYVLNDIQKKKYEAFSLN